MKFIYGLVSEQLFFWATEKTSFKVQETVSYFWSFSLKPNEISETNSSGLDFYVPPDFKQNISPYSISMTDDFREEKFE